MVAGLIKMGNRYLVLDLDNTLIYARPVESIGKLKEGEFSFRMLPSRCFYKAVVRRHFKVFINSMKEKGYKLVVWSAGSEYYVKCIVSALFTGIELEYVLTYNHLTNREKKVMDTLAGLIIDIDIDQIRLLDDNKVHKPGQEKNFVYIKPFTGEQDDALLKAIDDIERSYNSKHLPIRKELIENVR
jgi:2-hydroxy-3-keto-5-methylthiopentenyl-1-phosphate phosphatase